MPLRFDGRCVDCWVDRIFRVAFPKAVIATLSITILVEGAVGFLYAILRRKPVAPIVVTSIFANLITQSLLWVMLNIFFQYYLSTLLIAEILIWLMESVFLYGIRLNRLSFS